MDPLDSRTLYTGLVAIVALMRLAELVLSRRNIARLFERGAVEVGHSLYPWMVAVHTTFLVACVTEVWLLDRPLIFGLEVVMLCLLVVAAALRWWVISSLGDRWSTRVVLVPGDPPVTTGPFRWLRHPNYLAVIVEVAALPLVHTAWITALAQMADEMDLKYLVITSLNRHFDMRHYLGQFSDRIQQFGSHPIRMRG